MAGSEAAVVPTLTPIGVPGGDDDTPSASPTARVEVGGRVKQAYSAIQSCTGGVGGDGSQGPIYGEMTIGSMQRVLDCFVEDAGFGPESVFMDVGSGLGKPNIHAACMPSGCRFSIGVECEPTRYNLSMVRLLAAEIGLQWALAAPALRLRRLQVNLQRLVEQDTMIRERCNLFFILANILRMRSLTPVTHLFSFDVGMPHRILRHLARLFHASPTCRYIMVFRCVLWSCLPQSPAQQPFRLHYFSQAAGCDGRLRIPSAPGPLHLRVNVWVWGASHGHGVRAGGHSSAPAAWTPHVCPMPAHGGQHGCQHPCSVRQASHTAKRGGLAGCHDHLWISGRVGAVVLRLTCTQ